MANRVTIVDVAKKSGYGVGTVSRVISGDKGVKQSTREAILKTIEELNFTPNINGARLKQNHSNTIAVLVPVINHPFFARFVEEVSMIAIKNGYSLTLVTSQFNIEMENEILKKIKRREIDGAIFVTHYNHSDEEIQGCPLVSVDRHLNDSVPYVSSDNYEATRDAIEYLISTGASRIGYVGTTSEVETEVTLREKAYLDVMREHNLEPRFLSKVIKHGEEEALVDEFLEKFSDVGAIFASGTSLTNIIYYKLLHMGVKMPEDVQLISYDGVFSNWNGSETISCIQQPIEDLALGAFTILIDLISKESVSHRNIFKTTFVKGQTTK